MEELSIGKKRPWQAVLLGVFCLVVALLSFFLSFSFLMMALDVGDFTLYFMKIFRVAILFGNIFIPAFIIFLVLGVVFLFIYFGISKGKKWAPILVIAFSIVEIIILLFVLLQILWILVVLNLIVIYLGFACLKDPFFKTEGITI